MYVLMFLSVYRLRSKKIERAFKIPGGKFGLGLISTFGLIGSGLTIIFGFIPPETVLVGSAFRYTSMIAIGNLVLITPCFLCILYRRHKK